MADTLTPEEKKKLTEELTKYANEGASDDDLRQFREAFISELKKKGGGQPASGAPAGQPTKPSAPSFGQKITEKIVNSASETQIPLKTGLQQEEEKRAAEKKAKIPTSKYFEVDVEEKTDDVKAPKVADPILVAKNSQKSKAIFNSVVGDKDIYKMPTQGESNKYASEITSSYLDYLGVVGSSKLDTYKEKYEELKSKPKEERDAQDELFLRQVEAEAIGAFYEAKEHDLSQLSSEIDNLEKTAVTEEDKRTLNDLYGQYEKKRNSLIGTSAVYAQNKFQYGKIAGREMADEEAKLRRFEALQSGDGKTIEFFKGIGGSVLNGVLSVAQVPKVLGDLVGDTDYDWSDQMYDMVSSQKSDLDREFGSPLPKDKNMSDLPLSARLAVVGGNAIGSAGLFAAGGGLIGATSNLGKAAATFGTAFLTSESGYYQEALDAGMSPQEAALAGTYLAAQTALVESIIPDIKYFEPSAFRKSVIQGVMSGVGKGLPVKEAVKMSLKNTLKALPEAGISYGKTGIKEAGEELLGQVGEDVGKVALNAAGQRQYFNDTFNPEAYEDAILGGFIAGGGMSVFSRPTAKSPVQEEVMREIVEKRPHEKLKGTASDKIGGKEDLKDFQDATEIFSALSSHSGWNVMSREEQNHAFALAQQAEVMKKEQERMKELRIPDERKDAEIKKLEEEVNQMFSMQMEQDKQKAKDAKLKAIEDELNKSIEGEEYPVQEDERDAEIVELQKQREERGVNEVDTFFSDMKPMVPFAVERMEQGQPVAQSVKEASSNYLYKKYKELTDMKSDPNRMMTRQQISNIQKQLEQDIRTLEGTTETKAQTNDQENIQGIPSEVGVGQESVETQPVETTSEEATPAGGVLQAQEEVTPTTETVSETTPTPFQKQKDLLGNDKQPWMYEATEAERNQAKKADGKNTARFFPKKISKIKNALQRGLFEKAIKEGKMTAQQAADVISSADLEVPASIMQAKPTTEKATEETKPEPQKKQPLRKRVASLFETSEGEKSAEKVGEFLKEANIDVETLDPKDFEEKGSQRNFEGDADGVFLVDNNTGKIYLNREKIKTAEGKVIAFHEGIHPVINIIRNTNPKQYQAIVDGLKAEAARNQAVAEAAAAVASSEEYQRRGPESIEDETVVETMARVAAGDIDIDTFEPTFREKFIEFMNKIAKTLGIGPIAVNSPRMEVQRLAKQLTTALNEGGKISDIVGKKNVGKFQATSESLKTLDSPLNAPTALVQPRKGIYGKKIKYKKGGYELSMVKPEDIIDIEALVKEIADNKSVVWFWTADQLGRGMYSDETIEGEHYLDAGPSFALDEENRAKDVIWASGADQSTLKNRIEESDYIFIISGSPQKSKLFNKRVLEFLRKRTEKASGLSWNDFSKKVIDLSTKKTSTGKVTETVVAQLLKKYNSFEELLSSKGNDKKNLFVQLEKQRTETNTPLSQYLKSIGLSFDVDTLRDGFYKENGFDINDVMLVLKPTKLGGKSNHSTYEYNILGTVVGVPDKRVNGIDLLPEERRKKYTEAQRKSPMTGAAGSLTSTVQASKGIKRGSYIPKTQPLAGSPTPQGATGPIEELVNVAESYAKKFGIPYTRQAEYVQVDEEFSKEIADAYEAMKHDPSNPKVKEAYDDLIRQTTDQYNALVDAGYEFTFFDSKTDPYNGNPVDAMRDLRANKKMAVYGTYDGYGTGSELNIGLQDPAGGPDLKVGDVLKAVKDAGGEVVNSSVYESDTEPTLVVKLKTKLDDKSADKLSSDLGQESIAQRFDDETGKLYGPQAEKWGDFNPEFFVTLDGRRASDTSNPMLADTGLQWPDQNGVMHKVTANDLFRAVHDAFGHGLEGAGFRARGEENAWQAHARLFVGPAVGAITTETRGQNSWLNYGPYGEKNRKAKLEDTVFAEQKTGLMPEWTWTENVAPAMDEAPPETGKPTAQPSTKIPRTQSQIREATENAMDAVEEAIADGMSPQQAIDENISNQDWYGDLTPAQKEQLNNILQDEFGVTASEPKLQNNAQRVADLWEKGGKEAKAEIKNILETDPELSYIYNNFPKITKQLEEQGLLTKTENCP